MAQRILTTSYLAETSNSNHDGVTQQICDRLVAFVTDNQMLIDARQGVVGARGNEDIAYQHFSNKDFASDDLKSEDSKEDKYMSTILGVLNGLLNLPEDEPLYRKAQEARQVFKDFNFRLSDGYESEARKTLNMVQEWTIEGKYELDGLGIRTWVEKANTQAQKVVQLVNVRIDHEAAKIKGELANARKATDEAIRKAYDVINALMVLAPTAELAALVNVLLAIEERAKLYYISGGSGSGSSSNSGTGQQGGSGSNENNNQNDNGGGTEQGGGTNENDNENQNQDPGTGGDNGGSGTTDPETPDNPGGGDNGGGSEID